MGKINKRRIVQNVSSSWFSLGVTVVTGILLSPFILHHLGDAAFGEDTDDAAGANARDRS